MYGIFKVSEVREFTELVAVSESREALASRASTSASYKDLKVLSEEEADLVGNEFDPCDYLIIREVELV